MKKSWKWTSNEWKFQDDIVEPSLVYKINELDNAERPANLREKLNRMIATDDEDLVIESSAEGSGDFDDDYGFSDYEEPYVRGNKDKEDFSETTSSTAEETTSSSTTMSTPKPTSSTSTTTTTSQPGKKTII